MMQEILNQYSNKYNSHPRQTEHLYNLCDGNLEELNLLFIKIYLLSFNTFIPSNKEDYNVYKQASLKFQHKNGLLGEMVVSYDLLYIDKIMLIYLVNGILMQIKNNLKVRLDIFGHEDMIFIFSIKKRLKNI